ncbi:MAG: amidohydrolase [Saprospiraceae bacterium]|nr:amidohydrolase [Saprospiraceae bacterium]
MKSPVIRVLLQSIFTLSLGYLAGQEAFGQDPPDLSADDKKVMQSLDNRFTAYAEVAHEIWTYAELGYIEHRSSKLLQDKLAAAGLEVAAGVANIPTAFAASYGTGKPVIGILAEFDALPGVSQDAVPYRKERTDCAAGHACGHHLFGTASAASGIAIKEWLEASGSSGTIKVFGTPAEEGGAGKVYMARDGVFDGVDVMLNWHPGDGNSAGANSCLAIKTAKFRFHGAASHAAVAPERGRSALDGVEAMNDMANMLREHVPEESRIHYVITKGGEAPNVVPAEAEVYYAVRHPQTREVKSIFDRIVKCAEGAATGTGTTMDYEVVSGAYNLLPNRALAEVMDRNLRKVGGVKYTAEERQFAEEIITSYPEMKVKPADAENIGEFYVTDRAGPFSTDVGDVSWLVPTAGLRTATWVPGTSSHSWQAVAAGGMSIGHKGMMVAAKTMALAAIDIYKNPDVVRSALKELKERQGEDFKYEALLGNREAPLDYRVGF